MAVRRLTHTHPVHTSLHRPLTVWGLDLRAFAVAAAVALLALEVTASMLAAFLLLGIGYGVAVVLLRIDPKIFDILWRHRPDRLGGAARRWYDAAKETR